MALKLRFYCSGHALIDAGGEIGQDWAQSWWSCSGTICLGTHAYGWFEATVTED